MSDTQLDLLAARAEGGPWVHRDGEVTERAALEKIAPHMHSMRESILAALANAPEGLTPDEFADERGLLINTVRRRFVDLWKMGRIRKTDLKRPNSNGNDAKVWTLV